MARHLLLAFIFLLAGFAVNAQTSLQGRVTDAESGQPILFGTVALYKNGVLITGTETDFDGYYSITELDPGTYEVEFSYTGYQSLKITNIAIFSGKSNKLDSKISAGVTLDIIEVTWTKPLVEQDNTTQGQTLTSEEIKNLPTRSVNALASLTAGAATSDEGAGINIRGSRQDGTNYYVDGIRVNNSRLPKSEIEQLQVITGGIEARYGDVTGGIISLTSKGPSDKFGGGVELETSELFNNYGHNLASLNLSGPILKKNGRSILGYRISGQYQYNKDDDPPATSVYYVKDEVREQLEQEPIRAVGSTYYPTAEYLGSDGVDVLDYRKNESATNIDIVGKIDASLGKNVDVTFSGSYFDVKNKFTPGNSREWQIYNSIYNPTTNRYGYRTNFRLRHRLGTSSAVAGAEAKASVIQNAAYNLQFGYEKDFNSTSDPRHGDKLFDYGYIGKYDSDWEPTIQTNFEVTDSLTVLVFPGQVGYTNFFKQFTPNTDINPILTRYVLNAEDASRITDFDVLNGNVGTLDDIWGFHTNVGAVYNSNNKSNSELYTFNANTSFELVPKASGGGRHQLQFGVLYEQRVNRSYNVAPFGLWNLARNLQNQHIFGQGLDSSQVISELDGFLFEFNPFTGETLQYAPIKVPVFAPNIIQSSTDNLFFKNIREKFGIPINQFINIDELTPGDLSLDMFSARELNDQGYVRYEGYDYLGNQVDGISFEDFFTTRDANGIRTFPVAASRPNYQSAFVQDKFTFKDIIFRLGLRVDRFDANTKILKDPYSLYDVMTAGDFTSRFGGERPGNIADDFKVYVTSDGGKNVQAYREGDTWYFPNGNPANDGTEIFGGGLVFPRYAEEDESKRNVTSENFDPDISFADYTPQISWMPRLAFSFPISDEANFFAHYDILVQRPPSNTSVSPLTYFYWETNGSGLRNNANLKPERTVDYEVGFQQKLSNSSALKLSAYYKELRDMIQSRFILFVPAPVNQYSTFDNLDFATVKGFSIAYDLRRTGNVSLNINYTLQFADGTGSNSESSRGLSSRGIQRTLFPMSFDDRHTITGIIDYRYGSGKRYNGPRIGGVDIFANAGINLTGRAVSGRPYTAAVQPEQFGSSGILGSINGSRKPWNLTLNAQVDKTFTIARPGTSRSMNVNVYLRVSNVLDRRNIINVYGFTGSPTDDGFLNSVKGQSILSGIEVNEGRTIENFLASYSWSMLNPNNYSLPRRMFLGVTFDF